VGLLIFLKLVGALVVGIFLLSRLSGWASLSKRFPFQKQVNEEFVRFFSISLKGSSFRLPSAYPSPIVNVGLSREGISILSHLLFHQPIFIPWGEVSGVEGRSNWVLMYETILLKTDDEKLVLKKWGIKDSDIDIAKYRNRSQ
jgi:hypothetical protein